MTDDRRDARHHRPMRALVVPADPSQPVREIDLNAGEGSLRNLQQAVGGYVDVQAHAEGDIWVHDEGRIIDLPVNVRVSHWVLNESEASKQGTVGEWSVLYGDAVITGRPDAEGESTAVSQEMVDYFKSVQLSPEAMKDWDVRNVGIQVMEWPELDQGRDDGPSLGPSF